MKTRTLKAILLAFSLLPAVVTRSAQTQPTDTLTQLLAATSLTCQFSSKGTEATWDSGRLKITEKALPASMTTLTWGSIDRKAGKARLIADVGPIDVVVMTTKTGITLIEETFLGNLNFTTVFANYDSPLSRRFLAVRSFHQSVNGPFPSQYYGTCRAWH